MQRDPSNCPRIPRSHRLDWMGWKSSDHPVTQRVPQPCQHHGCSVRLPYDFAIARQPCIGKWSRNPTIPQQATTIGLLGKGAPEPPDRDKSEIPWTRAASQDSDWSVMEGVRAVGRKRELAADPFERHRFVALRGNLHGVRPWQARQTILARSASAQSIIAWRPRHRQAWLVPGQAYVPQARDDYTSANGRGKRLSSGICRIFNCGVTRAPPCPPLLYRDTPPCKLPPSSGLHHDTLTMDMS